MNRWCSHGSLSCRGMLIPLVTFGFLLGTRECPSQTAAPTSVRTLRVIPFDGELKSQPNQQTGGSWATAFNGLNEAILHVKSHPLLPNEVAIELLLKVGVYYNPSLDKDGKPGTPEMTAFSLPPDVHLRGGFEGGNIDRGRAQNKLTVISGHRETKNDKISWGEWNHFTVILVEAPAQPGAARAPNEIENVIITEGRAAQKQDPTIKKVDESGPALNGGGVFVRANARLTMTNVLVTGNFAMQRGGGIYNAGILKLVNCTIGGNSCGDEGGGIATAPSTKDLTAETQINSTIVAHNAAKAPTEANDSRDALTTSAYSTDDIHGPIQSASYSFFSSLPDLEGFKKANPSNLVPGGNAFYYSPGFLKAPRLPTAGSPGELGDFRLQRSSLVVDRGEPTDLVPLSWRGRPIISMTLKDGTIHSMIAEMPLQDGKTRLLQLDEKKNSDVPNDSIATRSAVTLGTVQEMLRASRTLKSDLAGIDRYQGQRLDMGAYEYPLDRSAQTVVVTTKEPGNDLSWEIWPAADFDETPAKKDPQQIPMGKSATSLNDILETVKSRNSNDNPDDDVGHVWLRSGLYRLKQGNPLTLLPFVEYAGGFSKAVTGPASDPVSDEVSLALRDDKTIRSNFHGRKGGETIIKGGGDSAIWRGLDCQGVKLDRLVLTGGIAPPEFTMQINMRPLRGAKFGDSKFDFVGLHPFTLVDNGSQILSIHSLTETEGVALTESGKILFVDISKTPIAFKEVPVATRRIYRLLAATSIAGNWRVYILVEGTKGKPEAARFTLQRGVLEDAKSDPRPLDADFKLEELDSLFPFDHRLPVHLSRITEFPSDKLDKKYAAGESSRGGAMSVIQTIDGFPTDVVANQVAFVGNKAAGEGGAIWTNSRLKLEDCSIVSNTCETGTGGGIHAQIPDFGEPVTLTGCAVAQNTQFAAMKYVPADVAGKLNANSAWNVFGTAAGENSAQLAAPERHNLIVGSAEAPYPAREDATGKSPNTAVDNPARWFLANQGDFKTAEPTRNAPFINLGDPERTRLPDPPIRRDLKGTLRVQGYRIDIGAYEYPFDDETRKTSTNVPVLLSMATDLFTGDQAAKSLDMPSPNWNRVQASQTAGSGPDNFQSIGEAVAKVWDRNSNGKHDDDVVQIQIDDSGKQFSETSMQDWKSIPLPPFVAITSKGASRHSRVRFDSKQTTTGTMFYASNVQGVVICNIDLAPLNSPPPSAVSTPNTTAAPVTSSVPHTALTVLSDKSWPCDVTLQQCRLTTWKQRAIEAKDAASDVNQTRLVIVDSELEENGGPVLGGAVLNTSAQTIAIGSYFGGNKVDNASGGAVAVLENGTLYSIGCTYFNNSALSTDKVPFDKAPDPAANASAPGFGGAIAIGAGRLVMFNSTLAYNRASLRGGAISFHSPGMPLAKDEFANNFMSFNSGTENDFEYKGSLLTDLRFAMDKPDKAGELPTSWISRVDSICWKNGVEPDSRPDKPADLRQNRPGDLRLGLSAASLSFPNYFSKRVKSMRPLRPGDPVPPTLDVERTIREGQAQSLPLYVYDAVRRTMSRNGDAEDGSPGAVGRPPVVPYLVVVLKDRNGKVVPGKAVTLEIVFNGETQTRRTVTGPDGSALFRQISVPSGASVSIRHDETELIRIPFERNNQKVEVEISG